MTTGQMYDLAFTQLDDGTIRLEQRDYCGESAIIDLHPYQLQHVAERAGLLPPSLPMPDVGEDNDEMHHLHVVGDDDGTVHLYQTQLFGMGGSDEHVILHPTQAVWLGARLLALCHAKPVSSPLAASSAPGEGACPSSMTQCDSRPSDRDLFASEVTA